MNVAAATRQPLSRPEWFASWFDSTHYHRLYAHRDETEAAGLVDRLIEQIQPADAATMLDLGCGTGRHSRYLASKGFRVLGLDLSAESIRQAKQSEGPNLWFRRQDMRLPFGTSVFDCVLNLFTSFGYFADPAEHLNVVANIARSLKPGGLAVIDYLNVLHAERHLTADEIMNRDGVAYLISRWTDADHIFKRIVIDNHRDAPLDYVERVAKLTVEDFRFMFALFDMTIEATWGDYGLMPFEVNTSPRLILTARKTGERRLLAGQTLADAADRLRSHAEV